MLCLANNLLVFVINSSPSTLSFASNHGSDWPSTTAACRKCLCTRFLCRIWQRELEQDNSKSPLSRPPCRKCDILRESDPQLDAPAFRRKHRRHLSAMLRLLMKTLDVRNGYREEPERVDLVVFPELSVHPGDIQLLERFADSAKCMVFCGLVFHRTPRQPDKLINSGMWILPVRTDEGRSMQFVEQGKRNLTQHEKRLGILPYRPCQWLIEAQSVSGKPWRLSAAICYDATDLSLAADLRNVSDAFIVAALNRDIGTFDAMVSALHYHMFQHIVLVNCAEYGGSTLKPHTPSITTK